MIVTSLDFDKPGKQQGFLQVAHSHNLGGWANVFIPTAVVARGKGPTVLGLGGNHGDEYQGQIAPDRAPESIVAQTAGYLITMRAPCLTQQGDCVAVIAQRVSAKEVMRA